MTVLRTAYVAVRPDTTGFDADLTRRLKRIDASKDGNRIGQSLAKGFADKGGVFAKVAATMAARLAIVGTAAAAATPGVVQLTAALAPAAGALVALPAAMLAVKAASATLRVATAGVSEAISAGLTGTAEQAEEALEALPPAARTFAKSIIALKPQIEALKASVAERFFRPMQDDIGKTANLYLPLLTKSMSDLAGPLGGLGEQILKSARSADAMKAVRGLFDNTGIAVVRLRAAVDPLVRAFAALITATAPQLPGIATGFANMATNVARYVQHASESGRVVEIFQNAKATLRDLGGILGNVGSILGSVFGAATANGSTLLANLRDLTGQAAAFLKAGEGKAALTGIFETLSALGAQLRRALGAVLPAIAQSITALAPAVSGLAPVFGDLVVAVAPLLPYFTQIAATVLTKLTPAVAALAGWLAQNATVAKTLAIAVGVLFAAIKVYNLYTNLAAVATNVWSVAQKAATVATTVMTAVTRALGVAVRFALGPVGLAITAIGALTAAVVWAYKNNETFRRVVQTVWSAIKTAIKAVGDWFTGTLWPALRTAYTSLASGFRSLKDGVVSAWGGIRSGISTAYHWVRDNVFRPLSDFVTKTIPDKFRSGIATIGKVWLGLQALAAKPVKFVVDTVINRGIIGTFNKVSGFFGGPKLDNVPMPSGIGDGPGAGHSHGSAPKLPKGTGDGLGDMLGFLKGPANWIKGKVSGLIGKVGDHPFAQMLKGMGSKLLGGLIDKAKSLIGGSEFAGGGASIAGLQSGISGALAALRSAFGSVPLISGVRPGATTLSGNRSYHALGRAIDIAPVRSWAAFLHAAFGPRLKELITPWQELNLHNGRPHRYTGAVWNQHNFAGGNAHIHAALDDGGFRTLRPGYNVIPNFTGALEPIAGPRAMAGLARGNTYNINVSVPVGAHPAEVGRQIVTAIQAFEAGNGNRWRAPW